METKLPDCEKARIDDNKLYKYLLNPNHPEGKGKARFFEQIGYTIDNGEQLRAGLIQLACSGSVTNEQPNRVGRKYIVTGPINAQNGKTYQLLTVWAVEPPDNEPRLITAYPNK